MILYLDTSSLVKLYAEEEGSQAVRGQLSEAEVVATSHIAYAEARAAFARKHREGEFSREEYAHIIDDFHTDWESYLVIKVSQAIIALAGDLAEKHGLRGFDAIHLASALALKGKMQTPIAFSCADERLQAAAKAEGLALKLIREKGC